MQSNDKRAQQEDFVLEKTIFSNIFEKDIRRVFIYKKAERLAKAIHLITPAFAESVSLKNRIDAIAVGLIDAAIQPPSTARTALARELLALSSVLGVARTGGILSTMNVGLISREAHVLLHEIGSYEEPQLPFEESPTLSSLAKGAFFERRELPRIRPSQKRQALPETPRDDKGHIKDRRDSILTILKDKGRANIKDISTLVRGVSEKTIQRELSDLIGSGTVLKQGERRWSTYSLAQK